MTGFFLAKLRTFPWISLTLFCLTYGVFGWIAGLMLPTWEAWILRHQAWFLWEINPAIATQMAWGFGAGLIILLMIILTAPLQLMRVLFGSWLRSDTRAFISVLGWAFTAVLIICWLDQFARIFVLMAAGMLCHLDLQLFGCRAWQVFVILTVLSLVSYACGGYLFVQWHGTAPEFGLL